MFVSQQVSKSFFDRITAEYTELIQSFELHPTAIAGEMKRVVRSQLDSVLAMKARSGEGALDPQVQRKLKLELRAAQRNWTRHLVTSARLRRQRKNRMVSYLTPIVAA